MKHRAPTSTLGKNSPEGSTGMPSPPRDPKNPVPPPSAETSSKPQSPVPEDGIALTPLPSPLENAACPTPAPPDGAEEPAPPSMAIVIANRLDRDAVRGGVVTGKGGFGVAPQSQRRPRWPRRVAGWLRIAALVLCMIAFSVMASDKTEGWAGDSFDRYKEFRYLVAVNVIGFVYSAFQVYESYYRGVTMMYMGRRTRYFIHLLMDQALAYLLMSASSAAASRSDVWVSRFGSDAFTHKANGSVAVSFLAFIVLALTSIISAYNYFVCRS